MSSKSIGWAVATIALIALLGVVTFRTVGAQQPVPVQPAAAGGPKYTVVETDCTNLLVVDNSTNTIHFYTVDPGKEVGEDLHLRGSLDLNDVGKATLKPKKAEKKDSK